MWSSRWNENWEGKPKYSEKTCTSDTFSTTNPTWPDLGSNAGRRGGKPEINRLSYGTAFGENILLDTRLSYCTLIAEISCIIFSRSSYNGQEQFKLGDRGGHNPWLATRSPKTLFYEFAVCAFALPYIKFQCDYCSRSVDRRSAIESISHNVDAVKMYVIWLTLFSTIYVSYLSTIFHNTQLYLYAQDLSFSQRWLWTFLSYRI
jgi:hypothetical protein